MVVLGRVWVYFVFFFSSRRRHTRSLCDWSSDVCSSDLGCRADAGAPAWRRTAGVAGVAAGGAGADFRGPRHLAGDRAGADGGADVSAGGDRRAERHPGAAGRGRRCAHQPGVMMDWTWFHRFGSPPHFYRIAGRLIPWFAWLAAISGVAGLIGGLILAPPDYQQGEGYRIIYVHVPAAVLSTMAYAAMATAAGVGVIC